MNYCGTSTVAPGTVRTRRTIREYTTGPGAPRPGTVRSYRPVRSYTTTAPYGTRYGGTSYGYGAGSYYGAGPRYMHTSTHYPVRYGAVDNGAACVAAVALVAVVAFGVYLAATTPYVATTSYSGGVATGLWQHCVDQEVCDTSLWSGLSNCWMETICTPL